MSCSYTEPQAPPPWPYAISSPPWPSSSQLGLTQTEEKQQMLCMLEIMLHRRHNFQYHCHQTHTVSVVFLLLLEYLFSKQLANQLTLPLPLTYPRPDSHQRRLESHQYYPAVLSVADLVAPPDVQPHHQP